ncbi:DNA polymerase Y family protein [Acidicapsa ligni]|uniref:DNA polymerase Y family protein n=1 Tax=Acidicapsa ligni TaxID=542300 RepID=UPI0021DF7D06|nr:DNA polymerase [Acidicapsa ligni]
MTTTANAPPASVSTTPAPEVNWLFLDLNSYFASVEQEVRPELRNRPVAVVPSLVDTTCCIAASYEAKYRGVKTGTMVKEAKQLCPDIVLVEGRHELYTEYHHRIVAAVQSCIPVTAILSVDEMACRLIGCERPVLTAMDLGMRVKDAIRKQVGSTLRCSVGLAPNRFLAKIASNMEKPDGLVALTPDILHDALLTLDLRALPGVGARTEKRLNDKGIQSMADLLHVLDGEHGREQTGELWGSVWGERLWHWLRGDDFDLEENEHPKSVGHQHVLAPVLRNPESAWSVALKLLHRAAMRMRDEGLWTNRIGITIAFVGEGRIRGSSPFGPSRSESWSHELRLLECQDNATLIGALRKLWDERPQGPQHQKPFFISVVLADLVPNELHTLTLFDAQDGSEERLRLSAAMDGLNHKYGLSTVAPAAMLAALKAAPTRIAFHSVPELFDHSTKGISSRM